MMLLCEVSMGLVKFAQSYIQHADRYTCFIPYAYSPKLTQCSQSLFKSEQTKYLLCICLTTCQSRFDASQWILLFIIIQLMFSIAWYFHRCPNIERCIFNVNGHVCGCYKHTEFRILNELACWHPECHPSIITWKRWSTHLILPPYFCTTF